MTSTAGVTYTYDGDGKRVLKANAGTPPQPFKLYWYGVGGDPLVESDASGNSTDEYIFFGGKRIARRKSDGTIHYYFADHLGTSRVVTNATGTVPTLDDSDFYPFGGERAVSSTSGNTYKFTGKERDPETGLDYMLARYYSSGLGRFASPDEFAGGPVDAFSSNDPATPGPLPYASITDPQSLNKYAYVYNNPLRYTDPTGHLATGQVGSSEGMTINFRMRPGDSVYGCMPFCDSFSSVNSEAEQQQSQQTVAVDPGHGDQYQGSTQVDPGASGGGLQEKNLTLAISNGVSAALGKNGVPVIQTRTGDVQNAGVRLQWRIDATTGASILVSIHIDSAPQNPAANGMTVHHNSKGKALAESISKSNTILSNRGTKQSNFFLLRHFQGPAVLVEAGFISNASDRAILQKQSAQIGARIAAGIMNYLHP